MVFVYWEIIESTVRCCPLLPNDSLTNNNSKGRAIQLIMVTAAIFPIVEAIDPCYDSFTLLYSKGSKRKDCVLTGRRMV